MNTNILNIRDAKPCFEAVMVYGHFSTIHPGHIRYLKYAKLLGKKLIVSLLGESKDIKNRYHYSQNERAEALRLLSLSDEIILLEKEELSEAIEKVRPKLLVLGNEFKESENQEIINAINKQTLQGKKVIFHSGEIEYASTDLLISSGKQVSNNRKEEFRNACRKTNIDKNKLLKAIYSWESTNLIVIGDTILDQYSGCEALGMSAEAPVVVVKELETKNFIGGASIVASHIKSLGAECSFISVVGDDENAKIVEKNLDKQSIRHKLYVDSTRPTTLKKRYLVENQKLFRVSKLEEHSVDKGIEDLILEEINKQASKANGIIISDFVYGVITENILKKISEIALKNNLMIFGDVQCSSQVGSITRFKNFTLLCPNEREARIALHDKDSGLEKLSREIMLKTSVKNLIMKLGSKGFIAYQGEDQNYRDSQAFPALSINPLDVSGAGDALLAVMATGMASHQDVFTTAALACCVSCIAVENLGNKPIKKEILIDFIDNILD